MGIFCCVQEKKRNREVRECLMAVHIALCEMLCRCFVFVESGL